MDYSRLEFSFTGIVSLRAYAHQIFYPSRSFYFYIPVNLADQLEKILDTGIPTGMIQHSLKHAAELKEDLKSLENTSFRKSFEAAGRFLKVKHSAKRGYRLGKVEELKKASYASLIMSVAFLFHFYSVKSKILNSILRLVVLGQEIGVFRFLSSDEEIPRPHRLILQYYLRDILPLYTTRIVDLYKRSLNPRFTIDVTNYNRDDTLFLSLRSIIKYRDKNTLIYDMDANTFLILYQNKVTTFFKPNLTLKSAERRFLKMRRRRYRDLDDFLDNSKSVDLPKPADDRDVFINRFYHLVNFVNFIEYRRIFGREPKELFEKMTKYAKLAQRVCFQCGEKAKFKVNVKPHKLYCSEECFSSTQL